MVPCPLPLVVRLLARPGDDQQSVEVSGSGYLPQVALFTPEAGGCAVLAEDVRFTDTPAHTTAAVEVSDRHRVWLLALTEPVHVDGGAEVRIPAGALRVCCGAPPAATGGAAGDGATVPADGHQRPTLLPVGTRLGSGAAGSSRPDTQG